MHQLTVDVDDQVSIFRVKFLKHCSPRGSRGFKPVIQIYCGCSGGL
jgi:hypothetical protein